MILRGAEVIFLGDQVGVESYSFGGGLGMANGWVRKLDAAVDPGELGGVIIDALNQSEQDFEPPTLSRDHKASPVADALGLTGFDEMIRAGALAVTVFRRNENLSVESNTTDRLGFTAEKDNWTLNLPADCDAFTLGQAVLKARSHATVDFSR